MARREPRRVGPVAGREPGLGKPQASAADNPCAACEVRDLAVCGALEPGELRRLADIMTQVELAPQATIFYEGDPADYLYNVTQGAIRLHKLLPDGRRQITGFLFPGDFVGLAVNEVYAKHVGANPPARSMSITGRPGPPASTIRYRGRVLCSSRTMRLTISG